jgi:hypothetical protein
MKWGQRDKDKVKEKNKREPHNWFAWHPVILSDGRKAWLETVEREKAYTFAHGDKWFYRSIND